MMILLARWFARWAHRHQKRKYTNEPYFHHLEEVAALVRTVPHTWHQVAAAYLHDTVEDTWVRPWMIELIFGMRVAILVHFLTDASKPKDGNRATRKAIDRAHISRAPAAAKTVKLADLISNSRSICEHDPQFAEVYLEEKRLLMLYLKDGDPDLYQQAEAILERWTRRNKV